MFMLPTLPGVQVETAVPRFRLSRHRSMRIHKKLVKRFGRQFPMFPTDFGGTVTDHNSGCILVHPNQFDETVAKMKRKVENAQNPFFAAEIAGFQTESPGHFSGRDLFHMMRGEF